MIRRPVFQLTLALFSLALVFLSPTAHGQSTVAEVMDGVVTRYYADMTQAERAALTNEAILTTLSDEEKAILSEKYWHFDVNVPVVVSVMRHIEQEVVPFWLETAGFQKTAMTVKNEEYTYEVWQKKFDAGHVGLGINGFDWHRPVYFVSVAPQTPGASLSITNLFPAEAVTTMTNGAMTYRDWTSLVITELPDELKGQTLLGTFRGRAREAHLLGAFRETPHPSSATPDQIVLTWSEDAATTQTVQWRTSTELKSGRVQYRLPGADAWLEADAAMETLQDRLLANDRYSNHFTAVLRGLTPATAYDYRVGDPGAEVWSEVFQFTTAPEDDAPFIFGVGSDTHATEEAGKTLQAAFRLTPEMAFFVIPGDVVSYGLYRDQWDMQIGFGQGVYERKPLMFTLGNHDNQDGLGVALPLALFEYPRNGPEGAVPEANYSFRYGNALFLMMDVGTEAEVQAAWADKVLAESDATWKFAVHHFTMYNPVLYHEYEALRAALIPVFDRHHVDMVFQGHIHDYMRTAPLRDGNEVASPAEGTIYINACAQAHRGGRPRTGPDYIKTYFQGKSSYLRIAIDGKRLSYEARGQNDELFESLVIEK
ncbi:MAG: metallophosphoesterase family protein [Candidatus Hydrogenedentes bacterium]|nr:metallophosphoesterase family protein [Candidatus Hydrogenedentota bacterium]